MRTSLRHCDSQPRLDVRSLLGQVIAYLPATLVPAVVALLQSAVFTRLFEPAAFGLYSLAMSAANVWILFMGEWLQQAVNRYLPAAKDAQARARIKQAVGVALCLIEVATLAIGLLFLVLSDEAEYIVPTVAFVMVSGAYVPLRAVLQAEMRARRFAAFQVANSLLRFVVGLVLVTFFYHHPASLVWSAAASLGVFLPLAWRDSAVPSLLRIRVMHRTSWVLIRQFAHYGLPMAGWSLAGTLLGVGDRYVLQWFRGAAEVGLYSANYQLVSGAIALVTGPVLLAAHPFLMRAWSTGNVQQASKWLGTSVEVLTILGMVAVSLTATFREDFARLFLGMEFQTGSVIMPIVLAGIVVWNVAMYLHKPLEFFEKTTLMFCLSLIAVVVNLGLNVLLVPRYGYLAAAWTTVASYVVYAVLSGILGWMHLKWKVRWQLLLWTFLWGIALVLVADRARGLAVGIVGYWGGIAASLLVATVFTGSLVTVLWKPVVLMLRHLSDSDASASDGRL